MNWTKSNKGHTIGGLECIRRITPLDDINMPYTYEYTLMGKYGEIWENNDKTCKVLCKGSIIKNRLKNHQNLNVFIQTWKDCNISLEDQFIITIPNEYVKDMAKILKISDPGRQLKYAK